MSSPNENRPLSGEFHNSAATPVVKVTTPPVPLPRTGLLAPPELQSGGHTPAVGRWQAENGDEEDYQMSTEIGLGLTDIAGLEHLRKDKGGEATSSAPARRVPQAVEYDRVSNPKQLRTAMNFEEDGNSIATQRDYAKQTAKTLGAVIVKKFVERGRSAQTIANRPAFRAMIAYIEENASEIDYVIVYARSRLFRNQEDAGEIQARLRRMGVEIVSATERYSDDEDTADLQKYLTDWTNKKQVKENGRDIARKMLHKAQRGGFNGWAKLGYLNDKIKVEGYYVNTIIVDAERAPLIRWAFETYATGDYSLPRLQQELTDLGLVTRETAALRSKPVSLSQLAVMLRDPTYTGVIFYNGELYPGRHHPLINKELFLRVQDVLNGRVRRGLRNRVHHHYLRGLMLCRRCHDKGLTSQLVYTQSEGNGGSYEYFFCARKKSGECDLPYVPVHEVEKAVAKRFGQEHLSANTVTELRADLDRAVAINDQAEADIARHLRRQVKQLEGQEDRLVEAVADGSLPVEKLKARLRAVAMQRDYLTERLSRTDEELERGREALETYVALLSQPEGLYERATDLIRRQLLEAFFPPFLVDMHDDVEVQGDAYPAVRALTALERQLLDEPATNETSPDLSVGTRFVRVADLFFTLFQPDGWNKSTLVAGTGFEPATSGL
jgi:site-specific DNA recombinase